MAVEVRGFPLAHHNVFFCGDYAAEFSDIFEHGHVPREPTVYVCAQDRDDLGGRAGEGPERLFCIINAPARGDDPAFGREQAMACDDVALDLLRRCGLEIDLEGGNRVVTTPADFEALFPGTGGALYGRAAHGWRAPFRRPGARSRIRGLYLAGGSVHPGPGVPMVAVSGRLAAARVCEDLARRRR
jgi:1-hydroxycarotenoid 3,4-desaturase